jgi:hypothetical protein
MLRVFLTIVVPLLLPTALYLAGVAAWGAARGRPRRSWAAIPWLWLVVAGTGLLAIVLIVVTVGFGRRQEGVYVAPRYVNGRIIPGHFEPLPRR